MPEPIISVSGLRGIIGETLTPEVAIRYAAAFADSVPPGDFVIGRDSRPSGDMLSLAIQAGLQAVGRNTIDAGIVATPTLGILVRKYQAVGGIQITASHNPSPYNGLKLFSAEGRVIPAGPGQKVLERYRTGKPAWCDHTKLGRGFTCDDSIDRPSDRRSRHGRCRAHSPAAFPRRFGLESRRGQHLGPAFDARIGLPRDGVGRRARRTVRPSARADGRKPCRRAGRRARQSCAKSASAKIPTPTGWP